MAPDSKVEGIPMQRRKSLNRLRHVAQVGGRGFGMYS